MGNRSNWTLLVGLSLGVIGAMGCGSAKATLDDADGGTEDGGDGGGDDGGGMDGGGDDGGSDGGSDGGGDGGDPGPVDNDGDGYDSDEDCDDDDPDAHPGGEEGTTDADGVDNDCNGYVDDMPLCEGVDGYETLQEGIDNAPDGFTLLVCPGTYEERPVLQGRTLNLVAEDGPEVTFVVGDGAGSVWTIYDGGEVGISGFSISGGVATDNGGGGVLCYQSTANLDGNIVLGNTGANGGGMYAYQCDFDLTGNTFSGNTATTYGGGLFAYGGTGLASGNTFEAGESLEGGGVAIYDSSVAFDGNTVSGNLANAVDEDLHGAGGGGGGVWVYGSSELTNNTISGNTSYYNGGGLFILGGRGTASGNVIDGNLSHEDGGGAYTNQSGFTFTGNEVSSNTAYDDAGGLRVYVGSMTVTDNIFTSNVAADDAGGMKLSHSTNTIVGNWFEDNETGDAGGGLELDNETSVVTDCTFVNNRAYRGGGLHSWENEGTVRIENSVFEGNHASDCGGAIELDNDPHAVTLRNLWIEGNTSDNDGAGLCIDEVIQTEDDESTWSYESYADLQSVVFLNNVAADEGGAMYSKTGHTTLSHVTATGNSGGTTGGFNFKQDSTAEFIDSIVAANGAGYAIRVSDDTSTVTLSYSDVWGNSGGDFSGLSDPTGDNGNISEDPDFTDAAGGDVTLDSRSPAIDAGDPSGRSDADGSRADMGAYGGRYGDDW